MCVRVGIRASLEPLPCPAVAATSNVIELGELLCDGLDDASSSTLLRFAISSQEVRSEHRADQHVRVEAERQVTPVNTDRSTPYKVSHIL